MQTVPSGSCHKKFPVYVPLILILTLASALYSYNIHRAVKFVDDIIYSTITTREGSTVPHMPITGIATFDSKHPIESSFNLGALLDEDTDLDQRIVYRASMLGNETAFSVASGISESLVFYSKRNPPELHVERMQLFWIAPDVLSVEKNKSKNRGNEDKRIKSNSIVVVDGILGRAVALLDTHVPHHQSEEAAGAISATLWDLLIVNDDKESVNGVLSFVFRCTLLGNNNRGSGLVISGHARVSITNVYMLLVLWMLHAMDEAAIPTWPSKCLAEATHNRLTTNQAIHAITGTPITLLDQITTDPKLFEWLVPYWRLATMSAEDKYLREHTDLFAVPPLIVHVHVPKTAGSSVRVVLVAWCRRINMKWKDHSVDFLAMNKTEQDSHAVILGHVGHGIHLQPDYKGNIRRKVRQFTILRDPVERVYSHYWYFLKETNDQVAKTWDFKTWFSDLSAPNDSFSAQDNPTIQQLCCFQYNPHKLPNTWKHGTLPTCNPSREVFECAKRNLMEAFDVVGIQEHMNRTASLLAKVLNIPEFEKLGSTRENISRSGKVSNSTLLPDDERKLIEDANRWDIELYEFALSLFEERYKKAFESG